MSKELTCRTYNPITRRIGNTTFKVKVHFSSDATETMEDKILRLIRNEADTNEPKCGTTDAARCCTRKIPVALPLARNRATWYNGYATDEPSGLKGVQQ